MTSLRIGGRGIATLAAVAAAYYLAAKFGLSLAFSTEQVTAMWPPTGIALAAMLLWGLRVWPAVLVAAFAVNAQIGGSLLTAAAIAVGNTAAPLVAALALRRVPAFDLSLVRVRDVLAIVVLGALLGMTVSATNGVAQLALGGVIPWDAFGSVWWVWWVGDAMGVLVFAPLILSFATGRWPDWSRSQWLELGALLGGIVLVCLASLDDTFSAPGSPFPFKYAIFPFVIWAGLRFDVRETVLVVALVVGLVVWGAAKGHGEFGAGDLDQRLILLEMFIAAVAVTGLVLGAAVAERRRAQQALQEANDRLEQRVLQRTAELADANKGLAQKNEEVEAFVYVVSHDLRAPLVNLQGFSNELERSCKELESALAAVPLPAASEARIRSLVSDDIAGSLRFIRAGTSKIQRLIDALLTLSRTGKHDYRRDSVDVDALVEQTLMTLRQSIAGSGAQVSVEPLPAAMGDATAIGQVFANLISNALKYLQPGRPGRIVVGGEASGGVAHYWVCDNGAGIPANSQRRLFQVFQRFHPELAAGEGMGLAIVKRIVERHGGKVWAESVEGAGTTFHINLFSGAITAKE